MNEMEFEVVDELYFIKSFDNLCEELQMEGSV